MAVFIDLESDADEHDPPPAATYERRLPLRHVENPLYQQQVTEQVSKTDETEKHANHILGAALTCYPYAILMALNTNPPQLMIQI